jgi:hypothetical protein
MAGQLVTASDIHQAAGRVALNLKVMFQQAVDLNEFLIAHTEQELVALGMTAPDVALVKSALADLAYMKATAFDSSSFVKQLWGLGS